MIDNDIPKVVAHLRSHHGVTTLGCVGFCWGGRIAAGLATREDSGFSACGGIHAAMIEPCVTPRGLCAWPRAAPLQR